MNRPKILFVIFTFYEKKKREFNPLDHIKIQICSTQNKSSLNI